MGVLAYLFETAIDEAFHIEDHKGMIYTSKQGAQVVYDDDLDRCLGLINKHWVLKTRPGLSKVPSRLHIIDFKEEFGDLITLLNRVIGSPQSYQFDN